MQPPLRRRRTGAGPFPRIDHISPPPRQDEAGQRHATPITDNDSEQRFRTANSTSTRPMRKNVDRTARTRAPSVPITGTCDPTTS
ncbi:hypothetical protein APASM_4507 [Actinosynnema pretiosum subsp. pretiosum]|nr:hypothetical protein APASM_4507 [Actinosynnema pretiosum subsp. pretiosum]